MLSKWPPLFFSALQAPGSAGFRTMCEIRTGEALLSFGHRLSIWGHLKLIETCSLDIEILNWQNATPFEVSGQSLQTHPETRISLINTLKLFFSHHFQVWVRWNTRTHTIHMLWVLFGYCPLVSRMTWRVSFPLPPYRQALEVRSPFRGGFQATHVGIKISPSWQGNSDCVPELRTSCIWWQAVSFP